MKTDVKNLDGQTLKQIELPDQFNERYEPGIIQRAIRALDRNQRQPYGAMFGAGMGVSAKLSRRRRNYKGSYGHSISRAPRKTTWRRGMQFGWTGALAPGTRGGRRANPPKAGRDWTLKVNKKEKSKATRSALSALAQYKKILILDTTFEEIKKTQELITLLTKLGFSNELARTSTRKLRPGIGKLRGRKYRTRQGPLLIITTTKPVQTAATNIPGFETVHVRNLNAAYLTHGTAPRMTIWSEDALHTLQKEKLFTR